MFVLHVHYTDQVSRSGGGVVAMNRLHEGLRQAGVDSRIVSRVPRVGVPESTALPTSRLYRYVENGLGRIAYPLGFNDINYIGSFALRGAKEFQQADVINIHGLQGGYFSYLALPWLTRDKPAVLTLHDMWPFTGHCAYNYECQRWITGCGRCPHLDTSPPVRRDSTAMEWKLKERIYSRSNLAVVTLSRRRTEQVKQSILRRFPLFEIPNGIDSELFRPLERAHCRSILGIPQDKYVLLFAAARLSQHNKGPDILIQAVNTLPAHVKRETVVITMGDRGEALSRQLEVPTIALGYLSGDPMKRIVYSAADVFAYPTRAESLPLVVQESMACGLPAVSFDVGGVPDLVRHGDTGWLAPENDEDAFRAGLAALFENGELRRKMAERGRALIASEYSVERQIRGYMAMYAQITGSGSAGPTGDRSVMGRVAGL